MYNQNRIYRVLQLIAILQKNPAKSIKLLASLIQSTERTVYRYLDLIKELGFNIQKDEYLKYYIEPTTINNKYDFTENEYKLIYDLIQTAANKHKLKDSILKKLIINHENKISSKSLLNAHLSVIIENITNAIKSNKQIELKSYQSANSNSIKNRVVEPIQFTDNYAALIAYEIKTKETKLFNIERIGSVKMLSNNCSNQKKYHINTIDAFGFKKNKKTYTIQLLLNLRAFAILKQEFPLTKHYITKEKNNTYRLCIQVYDLRPITRFVLGLRNDIEVLGDYSFKTHLKKEINEFMQKLI